MTLDTQRSRLTQALDLQRDGHAVLPEINASFARGFTFQAWVRPDDLSRRTPIFALGNGVAVQALTLTGVAVSGDLELQVIERAGSQRSLVAPKALEKGRWTHLSIVISEQGTARIVKDGVELASAAKFSRPSPGSRSLGFLGRSLAPRGETRARPLSADPRRPRPGLARAPTYAGP